MMDELSSGHNVYLTNFLIGSKEKNDLDTNQMSFFITISLYFFLLNQEKNDILSLFRL